MENLTLFFIGLLTGSVTGFTGASGVMIVIPLVHIILGYNIHLAIGTSLMVDVITPLGISYSYYKKNNIKLKSTFYVALASIIAAQIGSQFVEKVPEKGLSSTLGFTLVLLAILVWKSGVRNDFSQGCQIKKFEEYLSLKIFVAVLLSSVSGFFTGFLGIGGGTNIFLILLFVCGESIHIALGTSILVMALTAASGVIGHASLGNVRFIPGLIISLAAVISGTLCARKASNVSAKYLAIVMGAIYFVLGVIIFVLTHLEIATEIFR